MATLLEGSCWVVNEEAARLHAEGLGLAVDDKQFTRAHEVFENALNVIHGSRELTDDTQVQAARVHRDNGFTFAREGLAATNESGAEYFDRSQSELDIASSLTAILLPSDISRRATAPRHKELISEHGATLGSLGRMVVARQVKLEQLPAPKGSDVSKIRAEQHYFGKREAHKYLKVGSNMYYLVSNAMHGAQAERLNGKAVHMAPWLGRAVVGLARAAASDRKNFKQALGTALRVGFSLRSRKAAAEWVVTHP